MIALESKQEPIGGQVALNGDDPARIAARLILEVWAKQTKERSFNRLLTYPKLGIV
jgi:hypothetical protein